MRPDGAADMGGFYMRNVSLALMQNDLLAIVFDNNGHLKLTSVAG
jgi:hypothetical protein